MRQRVERLAKRTRADRGPGETRQDSAHCCTDGFHVKRVAVSSPCQPPRVVSSDRCRGGPSLEVLEQLLERLNLLGTVGDDGRRDRHHRAVLKNEKFVVCAIGGQAGSVWL